MIEQSVIRKLHNEVNNHYFNQHIDDYDTFVWSRVIEQLINTTHRNSNEIVSIVLGLDISSQDETGELQDNNVEESI